MHLYVTLIGQWRYSSIHDKLSTTMQIAKRVYSLAQEQNNSAMTIGACRALTSTLYHLGDFDIAQQYAMLGVEVWRSGGIQREIDEVTAPAVACLFFEALSEWHFAEISSAKTTMAKAIALASVHKNLRFCDLCKELGFGCSCTHNALGAGSASQDRRLFGAFCAR
jgi:hypothetical protein